MLIFLTACFFSVILNTTTDVKTLAGNGHARSDLFSADALERGTRGGAKPSRTGDCTSCACRALPTYWAPLYNFVRSRGYSVHDAQDLSRAFSPT